MFLQGTSTAELVELVESDGGLVTHKLHIIDAVGARLNQQQLDAIAESLIVHRIEDDISEQVSEEDEFVGEDEEGLCSVMGYTELIRSGTAIEWRLSNHNAEPATLKNLNLAWPAEIGKINRIELGSEVINLNSLAKSEPGAANIQFDSQNAPQLKGTQSLKIGFESKKLRSLPQSNFKLEITFEDQCMVSLEPLYADYHEYVHSGSLVGADLLHQRGITGAGVTVAVIDSGLWETDALAEDISGEQRVLARYNAITDAKESQVSDERGHGTHIASIIASSASNTRGGENVGHYKGIAPDVNLVAVKAFGNDGNAHFLDIVRAIQWIVDNRERYDIDIINISFATKPRWPYWLDPINQALMRAWASGITVVAAVGNSGPDLMTVGSPGNLPFIITVGAVSDSGTPEARDDDYIPSFSSRGPTPSGHVKPDLVAPGTNLIGLTPAGSRLEIEQPEFLLETGEMAMTGSSQAAALVSGIVALLLQSDPELSPDEVKCMLITSAEPAIDDNGLLAYSPFEQGYGYVNANRAITLGSTTCGDSGMDIEKAISEAQPTRGPAILDEAGNPSLPGLDLMLSPKETTQGVVSDRRWGAEDPMGRRDSSNRSHKDDNTFLDFDWEPRQSERQKADTSPNN
ncbi:MAG: S8 family peptidase [Pseudomonadota bacterium]